MLYCSKSFPISAPILSNISPSCVNLVTPPSSVLQRQFDKYNTQCNSTNRRVLELRVHFENKECSNNYKANFSFHQSQKSTCKFFGGTPKGQRRICYGFDVAGCCSNEKLSFLGLHFLVLLNINHLMSCRGCNIIYSISIGYLCNVYAQG